MKKVTVSRVGETAWAVTDGAWERSTREVEVPDSVAVRWAEAKRAYEEASDEIEALVLRGEAPAGGSVVPVSSLEPGTEFVRAGKSGVYEVVGHWPTRTVVRDGDGDERMFHPETLVRKHGG